MLKGINPVLTSDLLKILWDMGHGDELVITDAHYPAHSKCPDLVIDTAGVDVAPILEGIAPLFELDPEVPPAMIQDTEKDPADPQVEKDFREALGYGGEIVRMGRFDFYDRATKAYAVVRTGELRKYGCIIITKGVTNNGKGWN